MVVQLDDSVSLLAEAPAFGALPDAVLRRLARSAEERTLSAGTLLFEQGTRPEHLHVLVDGRVGLFSAGSDGETSTVVEVLHPIDQFILAAVLTDAPYLMSARALSDVRICLIDARELRDLVGAEPKLAVAMTVSLAHQYRMLVRQVKDLKLRSTAQRLGCFLLALARAQNASHAVRLPYDKQLIAARLGTTPENLSRAFATLRVHGVRTSGAMVNLDDPKRLAEYARPDDLPVV